MSKVKIQGNASGTGVVTLTAPNTNTDRTITLPDGDISLGVGIDDNATSTAITIDASENVGIGTTSPDTELHIKLDDEAAVSGLHFESADGTADAIVRINNAGDLIIQADDGGTGTTEQLRIKPDGRGLSQFTAKAWVNFKNQVGNVIRDSHNVSSLTDHGAGDTTINFTNSMANTNYAVSLSIKYLDIATTSTSNQYTVLGGIHNQTNSVATGSVRVYTTVSLDSNNAVDVDVQQAHLIVFGD